MSFDHNGLIVIGENINATRKLSVRNKNIVHEDDRHYLAYEDLSGTARRLDLTNAFPEDWEEKKGALVTHIGAGIKNQDMDFLTWALKAQEQAGCHILDICVDEMSFYPEERHELMRWTIKTAQSITDLTLSIDSSDSDTIRAGLEVYDTSKTRPAINSTNLEEDRLPLIPMAKEFNAILFGNGSSDEGMPYSSDERVKNMTELMKLMDEGGIPMEDRFLDPLVFPVGAGSDYGVHYLGAVKELREAFPDVHIFGGLSNISFGLPGRKVVNNAFNILAILHGCDSVMIDPLMNPADELIEFKLASEVALAKDEFAMKYIEYWRSKSA
jgi:5-methyltetrahydrofolate corrinoid/iron sulfur protein methyltransferase